MVWTPTKDYNIVRASPTSYYFSLTSAESSRRVQPRRIKTFEMVFPFYPDWDRPFKDQNEKKIC